MKTPHIQLLQRYKKGLRIPNFFYTFFIESEEFKGVFESVWKSGFGGGWRGGRYEVTRIFCILQEKIVVMEKAVMIPLNDAIPALWHINDCFGFKYPYAINFTLLKGLVDGVYTLTPIISQERISTLLENILGIDRGEYPHVHLILWLNANINHPYLNIYGSVDVHIGSQSIQGHDVDLLELFIWASHVPEGKEITLSYSLGNHKVDAVVINNEGNWFVNTCKSWTPQGLSVENAKSLKKAWQGKPGRSSGNARLCISYGVYRFLRDYAKVCTIERTSSLLHFIWMYLLEMGLETKGYEPANTASLNVNIGRYDRRNMTSGGKGNFHYPMISLLSFPPEFLSYFISK